MTPQGSGCKLRIVTGEKSRAHQNKRVPTVSDFQSLYSRRFSLKISPCLSAKTQQSEKGKTDMNSITKIFAGGRVVGEVSNGVFRKVVSASKHFLRSPRAIALDVDSIRQAKAAGAVGIQVTDRETGREYSCDFGHFDRFSFELDRGHGRQRALVLDRWVVTMDIESKAAKAGEVKQRAGTGPRVRNEQGAAKVEVRQLLFKGLL